MKARIKNQKDSLVISLVGKVDYETQDEVCAVINKALENSKKDETARKIVVNLKELEFVGSSGITQFVQHLKTIHNDTDVTPKYCGVRSEFQKIIKAFDEENEFEFFDDEMLTKKNGKNIIVC